MARAQKPVAVCVFTTGGELAHNRSAARYPIFTDPREALRALATNRDDPGIRRFPFAQRRPAGIALEAAGRELGGAPPGWLSPAVGASLLSAYGIPVVPWRQVNDWQEADHAARELGYPVAMKTANPALLHKSDAGAVALHLADEDALQDAYVRLKAIGGPSVLLEPMATEGLEWFVGGRQDGHFGAVVVVGLGGIYVEIFREPALRIAPIERQEASALIDDCRGAALLRGVRGEPARDREALAELIERTSWLLADFPEIGELDLNPVRVYPSGSGVCALDWRMLKTAIPAGPLATAGQAAARYPRKGFREGLS
jgi:acetyltransferase